MRFWSGPPQTPPLETHFFEGVGGGSKMSKKCPPPFCVRNHESFGFFSIWSRKSISGSRLHGVCMGRSGTSAYAVYVVVSRRAKMGGGGDLVLLLRNERKLWSNALCCCFRADDCCYFLMGSVGSLDGLGIVTVTSWGLLPKTSSVDASQCRSRDCCASQQLVSVQTHRAPPFTAAAIQMHQWRSYLCRRRMPRTITRALHREGLPRVWWPQMEAGLVNWGKVACCPSQAASPEASTECSAVQWSTMPRSRGEGSGVAWSGVDWSAGQCSQCNGEEWSGAQCSSVMEWNGMEQSGVGLAGAE